MIGGGDGGRVTRPATFSISDCYLTERNGKGMAMVWDGCMLDCFEASQSLGAVLESIFSQSWR
jgi:hypothetical protein